MLKIPDRTGTIELADSYIDCDSLVKPSIEDGYMTREEYIVYTWIGQFIIENYEGCSTEERESEGILRTACETAAGEFGLPLEEVMEIEGRGRMVRARNVPGFEENAIRLLGPKEAARIMGKAFDSASGKDE